MPDGPDRDDDQRVSIPRDDLRRLRELAKAGRKAVDRIRELEVALELERHRASPVVRVIAKAKARNAADVRELIEANGGELRLSEDDGPEPWQHTDEHDDQGDDGPDLDDDERESSEIRWLLSHNK